MAPRPLWKGYLKLSLVSCPIALYPAVDASERVSFRHVNRSTGNRLRQQLVDSVTGEAVEPEDKGRGYEIGEKHFVLVEDEELEAAREEAQARPFRVAPAATNEEESVSVRATPKRPDLAPAKELVPLPPQCPRIENTRTIDIERFIPRSQIDPRYHLTPYYIAPRDVMGQEAFAVIRDAMARKDTVAMGHIVLSNRERPIVVEPLGTGLRGMTLRYAHEIRPEREYFADIPQMQLPPQMVSLAGDIVDKMLGDFDPALLEDRYRTTLISMLREKAPAAAPRDKPTTPSPANVVNLMEILQRSLKRQSSASSPKEKTARRAIAAASKSSSLEKRTKPGRRSRS